MTTHAHGEIAQWTCKRCLLILAAALAAAVIFNALAPQGIGAMPEALTKPQWKKVSLAQAYEMFSDGAMFMDARSDAEYEQGHVWWAFNFSPQKFEMLGKMLAPSLVNDQLIVIYGRTASRWPAALVAQGLAKNGYTNVYVMNASYDDWREAGYPTTIIPYGP